MDQIGQYAVNAGFSGKGLSLAIAIAEAESKGDPTETGKLGEKGLWQIYPRAHPDWDSRGNLYDPTYNAKAAYAISNGGTNWMPWTTYKLGLYLIWLPQAEVAAQRVQPISGTRATATQALTHVPGFGSGAEQLGQTGLSGLTALPETFNRIGAWISTPGNWFRIVQVIVGGALILVAIAAISRPVTEPIGKSVAKVVK